LGGRKHTLMILNVHWSVVRPAPPPRLTPGESTQREIAWVVLVEEPVRGGST
jgi:hypothetical protein